MSLRLFASWWLNQPIWTILVKLGSFPQVGVKIKHIWNHHPVCDTSFFSFGLIQLSAFKFDFTLIQASQYPTTQMLFNKNFLGISSSHYYCYELSNLHNYQMMYVWIIATTVNNFPTESEWGETNMTFGQQFGGLSNLWSVYPTYGRFIQPMVGLSNLWSIWPPSRSL